MSSLAMAGVAGTMKLPAVTEGVIDEGPDEAVTLASGPPDPSLSTTLTPLMVTEVGSPISMVAAPLPDGSEKREKKSCNLLEQNSCFFFLVKKLHLSQICNNTLRIFCTFKKYVFCPSKNELSISNILTYCALM